MPSRPGTSTDDAVAVHPMATLARKLCVDVFASACAALSVSPVVTAMDRAITRNAAGAQKLWPALAEGLRELAVRPLSSLASMPTRWLVLVYTATYACANTTCTACAHFDISPSIPVLTASTVGNMSTGVAKDRAFARMYGVITPRPMPWGSYTLFFTRDLMAMAFIFSLPPIISPLIKERSGLSEGRATIATQLSAPVISQVFTTPLHLLGLSLYNQSGVGVAQHIDSLRTTYPSTLVLRMLRIIPAFSVGGVVNRSLRQEWHAKC